MTGSFVEEVSGFAGSFFSAGFEGPFTAGFEGPFTAGFADSFAAAAAAPTLFPQEPLDYFFNTSSLLKLLFKFIYCGWEINS